MSGVLCDKRVSVRLKGKEFKMVVKPAMLFGLETEKKPGGRPQDVVLFGSERNG